MTDTITTTSSGGSTSQAGKRRARGTDAQAAASEPTPEPPSTTPGLRERKKARTRSLLQEVALRLFHEQGYAATTIEQIALAADVSPATVYRYFPTKPDLVIYDDLDERMLESVRAQPPELTAVQAFRAALKTGFGALIGPELALQRERERLIRSEPELRAAMLDELIRTLRVLSGLVSERTGLPADDDTVVALAGAVLGVVIAAWFDAEGPDWLERFLTRFDLGMSLLESGFRV
jgi:AcrR family transcriptional regulator